MILISATSFPPARSRAAESRRFTRQHNMLSTLRLTSRQIKLETEHDFFSRTVVHLSRRASASDQTLRILKSGLFQLETRHVRFHWRLHRCHVDIPQDTLLDWMARLPKLRTVEVVITEARVMRCTVAAVGRGLRMESVSGRVRNHSLLCVHNASKLLALRGLHEAVVRLDFENPADGATCKEYRTCGKATPCLCCREKKLRRKKF